MKQLILILVANILLSFSSKAQITTLTEPCNCCPLRAKTVLNKSEINDIAYEHIIVLEAPEGYMIHLLSSPVISIDNGGTAFSFSSGNFIDIINGAGTLNLVAQFPDVCVTITNNSCSGIFGGSYQMPESTGNSSLYVSSTSPITGGGTNATMTLLFIYELIPY